jgi:hypothetical protein
MHLTARRCHDQLADMTLSVDVWVVDETEPEKIRILEGSIPGSDLAGVETTRTELWASTAVRSLGAVFLPQLAEGNLWVSNDEVEAFATECTRLLANRTMIASKSGYGEDYIQFRLTNMVHAARRALQAGGGVVVRLSPPPSRSCGQRTVQPKGPWRTRNASACRRAAAVADRLLGRLGRAFPRARLRHRRRQEVQPTGQGHEGVRRLDERRRDNRRQRHLGRRRHGDHLSRARWSGVASPTSAAYRCATAAGRRSPPQAVSEFRMRS